MCGFEWVGCERLNEVFTAEGAHRCFEMSCRICTNRGYRIECERCAIKEKFSVVMDAIRIREDMTIGNHIRLTGTKAV